MRHLPLPEKKFKSRKAEEIRLKALYRSIALRGDTKLSCTALKDLIGPDCAYHLYKNIVKQKS
jgi:hypothetical protein